MKKEKIYTLKTSRIYNSAIIIVKKLNENGFKAYFVGGAVRDSLLGIPVKEIDIVTNAKPDEIQSIFKKTVGVGKSFGVIIVLIDGLQFEVATFRKDYEYLDGRRPVKIDFSDEKEDALRRDFTINGLFFDPINEIIIDYVGGVKDIDDKIIRTIGEPYQRFTEDKLRMLRAIRFSAQLNFEIDKGTFETIKKMASHIEVVSRERIRDEFFKVLSLNKPISFHLRLMKDSGLWDFIGINFDDKNVVFVDSIKNDPIIRLVGLCWNYIDINKFSNIQDLFRLSNEDLLKIQNIIKVLNYFNDNIMKLSVSQLKRIFRLKYIEDALYFLDKWQCFFSPSKDLVKNYILSKYLDFKDELYPPILISGEDLKEMGLMPGPLFSKIIREVEDLQLEGKIKTKEQALDYIKGCIGV